MKVGDLVKVKGLASPEYGIITKAYYRGSGNIKHRWWNVYFVSLDYEVPFKENELEVMNEKGN